MTIWGPRTEKEIAEWRRQVAIKQVKRLSGQIGLRHYVPKVVFDPAELDETMRELISKHEVSDWHKDCAGAYFPHVHAVYLNVSSFGSRKPGLSPEGDFMVDLMQTIAHELTHARFGLVDHNDEFNKRWGQVLKGKRFPWVIPILPKNGKEAPITG